MAQHAYLHHACSVDSHLKMESSVYRLIGTKPTVSFFSVFRVSIPVVFISFLSASISSHWQYQLLRSGNQFHAVAQAHHVCSPSPGQIEFPVLRNLHRDGCSICRLPSFCVSPSGIVVLQESHRNLLVSFAMSHRCGLEIDPANNSLKFSGTRGLGGAYVRFRVSSLNTSVLDYDIINLNVELPYRTGYDPRQLSHMPHYLSQTFIDSWRTLDYLSQLCFGRETWLKSRLTTHIAPTILTNDASRVHQKEWFRGLHTLIRSTYPEVQLHDIAIERHADICFRSGVQMSCQDRFQPFLNNFRARLSALSQPQPLSDVLSSNVRHRQVPVIGFLTRHIDEGRSLMNVDLIKQHLVARMQSVGVESSKTITFGFSGVPFSEQLRAMSSVDVLVASHGAALSNVLFMKKGAVLIEILPFGYNYNYKSYAEAASVRHESLYAEPDLLPMHLCTRHKHIVHAWKYWSDAAFETSLNFSSLSLEAQREEPGHFLGNKTCKLPFALQGFKTNTCLRSQNLRVRPELVWNALRQYTSDPG
jgi:Glycosyltransferase 61